jgi:hypothetical protein
MSGPLNLADADLKGFDALEPGRGNAEVFEMKMDAVKNTSGTGKMPAGTPMIKVQFRLTENNEEGLENRRLFSQYIIPPEGYDQKKSQMMKGMVARLFIALGDEESTVLSKKFDPDFEDYVGRECVVSWSKKPKQTSDGAIIPDEYNNPVTGVKPAGSLTGGNGTEGGLL